MPVLTRAQATAAAADPVFQSRVRAALLEVAVVIHDGTATYTQAQYNARAALAAAVIQSPSLYALRFAGVVAANEFVGGHNPWVVPGAGDGSDPLLNTPNGDAALRAGITYAWDAVASTPETVP